MRYKYNPPGILKTLLKNYKWNSSNGKVLLTFDDGPNPESTPLILRQLDKYNIRAVFFCVGENLEKHPDLAKQILESGHTIGNHTYSHKNLRTLDETGMQSEIEKFNIVYKKVFNSSPQYFRPPYGRFKFGITKELSKSGLINVMWSLLPYDYKNDLNILKFAVTNYLTNDSIIVLHDSKKSLPVIEEAIEYIKNAVVDRSFEFGEPTECLK